MGAENISGGRPSTKETQQSEEVAVCIFERPQTVDITEQGFVDAHLTKESPTVQKTIKTSTEGGTYIPFHDTGFLAWHGVPAGARGRRERLHPRVNH